jgi:hypothetical protein
MSSEKDVLYSKINIVKNCLMAIEKVQKSVQDPIVASIISQHLGDFDEFNEAIFKHLDSWS